MPSKIRNRTYGAWLNMKRRCLNPEYREYHYYGGRGITIDPTWLDYSTFKLDMGLHPKGMYLDRKDNDKGYSKENCRWATPQQQVLNRRMQKHNTSGIVGVDFQRNERRWRARGLKRLLYVGKDFFEACCARKSWEAHQLTELLK